MLVSIMETSHYIVTTKTVTTLNAVSYVHITADYKVWLCCVGESLASKRLIISQFNAYNHLFQD